MRWVLACVALAFGCGSVGAVSPDGSTQDAAGGSGGSGGGSGGSGGNVGSTDASAQDGAPGPALPAVGVGHLQLWLTADRGVSCVAGEVTAWADESGKNRQVVRGAHKGPECAVANHTLAGVSVPYFSAPGAVAPFDAETLDIDLSFLASSDFTILVVERRWADRTPASGNDEWLVGTDSTSPTAACPAAGYQINLGYVYYDGFPALNYESQCYTPYSGTRGQVPPVDTPPPSPGSYDMVRLAFATAPSPTVWQNGVKVNAGGASGGPGMGFVGGSIGRAFSTAIDHRFRGDIAEVVIFDAALTDTEAVEMGTYFKQHWGI